MSRKPISSFNLSNAIRACVAALALFMTAAASSCLSHRDEPEPEPERPSPQIIFLFSPGGLGDMSYNDCILRGIQLFKNDNRDIDIYIYSPKSLEESERIFSDWLKRPESNIPVLFALASSDYEPMAEEYLSELALTPNKSILLRILPCRRHRLTMCRRQKEPCGACQQFRRTDLGGARRIS